MLAPTNQTPPSDPHSLTNNSHGQILRLSAADLPSFHPGGHVTLPAILPARYLPSSHTWAREGPKSLTPVLGPELAADGLTHVVEGVEVLGDRLVVLALQAGQGAKVVPLEAPGDPVELHAEGGDGAVEVGLLASGPAAVTAPQQTIGTWYRARKPAPCGEAYWGISSGAQAGHSKTSTQLFLISQRHHRH